VEFLRCQGLPYIEHQHDDENHWQSDIAFLNDQTLVLGAGKTLALLNIQDGVVKAEYQTDAIIQESDGSEPTRKRIVAKNILSERNMHSNFEHIKSNRVNWSNETIDTCIRNRNFTYTCKSNLRFSWCKLRSTTIAWNQ
jgi:hypothetical protein